MITALLLALRGFFFGAVTFVLKHWRIFLPLVVVVVIGLYINGLQRERDDAVKGLAVLNKYIVDENEKRLVENNTKDAIAKGVLAAEAKKHGDEIKQWRADYDALQKKYGTNKAALLAADASNALWRERVRLDTATFTQRLRDLPGPRTGSAESGRDGDSTTIRQAYDNLELACRITTSDYNALRTRWDSACLIYGCKP